LSVEKVLAHETQAMFLDSIFVFRAVGWDLANVHEGYPDTSDQVGGSGSVTVYEIKDDSISF
jgi:hypothetical protein